MSDIDPRYGRIELHPLPGEEGWNTATRPWWEVYGPDGELRLYIIDSDSAIDTYGVALAALGLKRRYGGCKPLQWLREGWDDYDPWGSGMMALGAVCDLLTILGEGHRIPASAGFWPGGRYSDFTLEEMVSAAADGDIPDYMDGTVAWLAHGHDTGEFTVDDLARAARILDRYLDIVRAAGRDY